MCVKNIFLILGILCVFVPLEAVHAQNKFEPTIWKEINDVTVTGVGLLGDIPDERLLCFAPEIAQMELKCFKPESPSLKKWTNTEVVFTPAANTPSLGVLKIYIMNNQNVCVTQGGNSVCRDVPKQIEISFGAYTAHPYILRVVDIETGLSVNSLTIGKEYEIQGYRFGDEMHDIYMGLRKFDRRDIKSWAYNSIIFTPSQVLEGTELRVRNPAAKSNIYNISLIHPVSDDPYSHLQSHLTMHHIPEAWRESKKEGEGIIVAVVDSGIDTNEGEFDGRIWQNDGEVRGNGKDDDRNGFIDDTNGWDFVRRSAELTPLSAHGTAVAGVIGARSYNRTGIAGIAPNVTIMPLTVSDSTGRIDGASVGEAIKYAVDHGAHIVNLSMGGPGFTTDFNPIFTDYIRYAADRNVLVVIAAGNGDALGQLAGVSKGVDLDQNPKSPVCNKEAKDWAIGVAAINISDKKTDFSDYGGSCVDLSALGEHVVSISHPAFTKNKSPYVSLHGTSFAAPIVSGIAALAWAENPKLTARQIYDILVDTGDRLQEAGIGRKVNAVAAVIEAKKRDSQRNAQSPITTHQINPKFQIPNPNPNPNLLFPDVSSSYPYHPAISWAQESGVVEGYPDGYFRPRRTVNRAEFLKIVLESDDSIDVSTTVDPRGFPDVNESAWYAPYVRYAYQEGIIEGYPDGYFRPDQTVNFAEALKMAYLTLGVETLETSGEWYERYLLHAQYNDVLFTPDTEMASNMVRQDTVWVVWKLMNHLRTPPL